ncbi:MAG: DUF4350 domain-containing protein [Fimbriimonadales bacterium]|nr:DUF4350 domain-containing protein [Fimbriimonadales bacterium]
MRSFVFPVFVALSVLALCAVILYVLGNVPEDVYPSTTSGDPGGALAFYEVLNRSGVKVERLFRPPSKRRTDIGVVVLFYRPLGPPEEGSG